MTLLYKSVSFKYWLWTAVQFIFCNNFSSLVCRSRLWNSKFFLRVAFRSIENIFVLRTENKKIFLRKILFWFYREKRKKTFCWRLVGEVFSPLSGYRSNFKFIAQHRQIEKKRKSHHLRVISSFEINMMDWMFHWLLWRLEVKKQKTQSAGKISFSLVEIRKQKKSFTIKNKNSWNQNRSWNVIEWERKETGFLKNC